MELSGLTLDLLRNFSKINSNLLIGQGNSISTKSAANDIVAEVVVDETFPQEIGIYNLNEFLGVISLFQKPEFDFGQKQMTIKEGKNKIKYVYAEASLLTTPKSKINMPTPDIEFALNSDQLLKLQKASAALSVGDLAIVGDGNSIQIQLLDVKNPTSNDFVLDLEIPTTKTFSVYMKIEKLKLFPGDYSVSISSKKISRFAHKTIKLSYYVAVESNSKF